MEATFRRTGRILHLHFPDGELIRTTPEHPFWVEGKGWTAAGALAEGNRIATLVGDSIAVSEVFDTEEWEPVYNLRVADFHTYFVGDEEWGWAAWAHNLYLTAVEEGGKSILRTGKVPTNKYVSADKSKIVRTAAEARGYATLEEARAEATRITTLANSLLSALKAQNPAFTETMVDGLFRKYGRGYAGDFSPPSAAESSANVEYGTDALFFALTSAPLHGGRSGERPRLTWEQATAVFQSVNQQNSNQTGFVPWVAPAKPNFSALVPLKPTNPPHGYTLPNPIADPAYKIGTDGQAERTDHYNAAYYETLLAYQVHGGGTLGDAEIVVWWGAKIGSNGSADVISVNPTTGKVTLWDSKFRAETGGAIQSETFTIAQRREKSRLQAVTVINALPTTRLSADLKQLALDSLEDKLYFQKTVRYASGSRTPVVTKETPAL